MTYLLSSGGIKHKFFKIVLLTALHC